MDVGEVWLQQDGAIAHTVRVSVAVYHFPGHLISINNPDSTEEHILQAIANMLEKKVNETSESE
ncbi:hypothetical protein J6590_004546 [Homalodisca vitripennis]|nr:hypothetical protein J6590_004546 [Homalodisca vitripennis]